MTTGARATKKAGKPCGILALIESFKKLKAINSRQRAKLRLHNVPPRIKLKTRERVKIARIGKIHVWKTKQDADDEEERKCRNNLRRKFDPAIADDVI